jgi:hypothetical protein
MKWKVFLACACIAALGTGLLALPLSVLIVKESEKIADSIRAFNNDCGGDKPFVDQPCMDRRFKLNGDLGQFVAMCNDELDFLSAPETATPPTGYEAQAGENEKRTADRSKDTKLQIRWALHWINCLGREDANECKQERTALNKEVYPFGRVGLMSPEPTHVGEEEAKHWHPMKVIKAEQGQLVVVDEKAIAGFVENFVKALATNDVDTQLGYYADRVNYYGLGQVTRAVIRKDLEHDIAKWPSRSYWAADKPKIASHADEFTAEFPMTYTLTSPQGTRSGTLQMTVRLKSQADTWQVTGIQKKVTQTAERR